MNFLIADTFSNSLGRLHSEEQKAVKITVCDFQMRPDQPGHSFHKLDRAKDRRFWSVRVNRDLRLIVHKTSESLLLCYVAHHDDAYDWAERRKLETHPKTGAAQIVEVRESVQEVVIPKYVEEEVVSPPVCPLSHWGEDELLAYGVPDEWLSDLLAATEDQILEICDHLPAEAAEAVLQLSTGVTPPVTEVPENLESPFDHPDALRRFRSVEKLEQLELALDYSWDQWRLFLHPDQEALVSREFGGPARIGGSAGTGKTVVALHRAVHLANKYPQSRILLTTFARPLARNLRSQLEKLVGPDSAVLSRIDVSSVQEVGERFSGEVSFSGKVATDKEVRQMLGELIKECDGFPFSEHFAWSEWSTVIDDWQVQNWEEYRTVQRRGRKKRLPENQRQQLWSVFDQLLAALKNQQLQTHCQRLAQISEELQSRSGVYQHVVVDEAQDVRVSQLKFFSALCGDQVDGLFFSGDIGQRIFQIPFSWKSLGVDIRGRSHILKVNYRTSHQIRRHADRLLPGVTADVDGVEQDRRGTVSVFNGPDPQIETHQNLREEAEAIGRWIQSQRDSGILAEEIGLFVRSNEQLDRARLYIELSDEEAQFVQPGDEVESEKIAVMPMHLAKGLEFKAVIVAACDEQVIPLESRLLEASDDDELREIYDTERHLLYVACTRARDALLITGVSPSSEFLLDLTNSQLDHS